MSTYNDLLIQELVNTVTQASDHGILCELMVSRGWYSVIVRIDPNFEDDLEQWITDNIKHPYRGSLKYAQWVFESEQDAAWFSLRWT